MNNVLPHPYSPNFPDELKRLRVALGMSCSMLSRLCNLHPAMIRRYENKDDAQFAIPRENTWNVLNEVIASKMQSTTNNQLSNKIEQSSLEQISTEDLIRELTKRLNCAITFTPKF